MPTLNKQQKNEIAQIIRQNGFDQSLFSLGARPSDFNTVQGAYGQDPAIVEAVTIQVEGKDLYFTFERDDYNHFAASVRPALSDGTVVSSSLWESYLLYFVEWLGIVKYELEEPDLWKTPFTQPGQAKQFDYRDDRPPTESERRQLKDALRKVQQKLEALPNFDPERAAKLEETVSYLENKLDSTTLFDWKNIMMGAIFTIYSEPWLAPFAKEFKDAVTQHLLPLVDHIFALMN